VAVGQDESATLVGALTVCVLIAIAIEIAEAPIT
jgi:hypothetical protein